MADEAKTSAIAYICIDYNMVYSVVKTAEKTNTQQLLCCYQNIQKITMFLVLRVLLR